MTRSVTRAGVGAPSATRCRRRFGAGIVAAMLAAAVLTGCAPELDPTWQPASWPVSGQLIDDVPAPQAAQAVTVGLRLRNGPLEIDARWAYLPGSHPVNERIEQVVRDTVRARADAIGQAYHPQAHPQGSGLAERGCTTDAATLPATELMAGRTGVVIACEVVVARGGVFAQTLRTVTATDGNISDSATTVYTDLTTGAVGTGADLFADPAALWTAVVEVLRREAGSLSLRPVDPPDETQLAAFAPVLDAAVLADDTVTVVIPADFRAPALDGLAGWAALQSQQPHIVAFEAAAVSGALTPLGLALAAASGSFQGPVYAGAGFDRTPCDLVPCIAMTLDDGPSSLTPGFLDVLWNEQAAATFYILGQNAQRYPDMVQRVAREGHEVGNHTWNHPYLTELTDDQIASQLGRTRAILQELSGQAVDTFRPPGGFVDDRVVAVAAQPAIMWSVDTRDWAGPDDESLAAYTIQTPGVGSIVLMHDIQAVSSRVFGRIVGGLNDRGFSLVTIDRLFDGHVPAGIVRHGPVP